MQFGAPGFELDRSEAQLKQAGIPFSRHSKMVKIKGSPRFQSYFLEITVNKVRRLIYRPEDVGAAIAEVRNSR